MEHQKYSTSKSKTFKEGTIIGDIGKWVSDNIEAKPHSEWNYYNIKSKQKYKITIVNLNE